MALSFIKWFVGPLELAAIKTPSGPIVTPRILATALDCPEDRVRRFINLNQDSFTRLQALTGNPIPNKEINNWLSSKGLKKDFLMARFHPDTQWLNHYSVAEVLYRSDAKNAFNTRIEFTKMLEKTWREGAISVEEFSRLSEKVERLADHIEVLQQDKATMENQVDFYKAVAKEAATRHGGGLYEAKLIKEVSNFPSRAKEIQTAYSKRRSS